MSDRTPGAGRPPGTAKFGSERRSGMERLNLFSILPGAGPLNLLPMPLAHGRRVGIERQIASGRPAVNGEKAERIT